MYVFQISFGGDTPTPFWCWDPESDPFPPKCWLRACLYMTMSAPVISGPGSGDLEPGCSRETPLPVKLRVLASKLNFLYPGLSLFWRTNLTTGTMHNVCLFCLLYWDLIIYYCRSLCWQFCRSSRNLTKLAISHKMCTSTT